MATLTDQEPRPYGPATALRLMHDFGTATHRRAVGFLVLVCLILFLPGFFNTPPIDRDEARFAQASKQMIETGDLIDIRYQDEVRYKKPVGIYWLQTAVVRAAEAVGVPEARTTIWLYRIPSLIGAIGAVLLTYWTALTFVSRRMAYLAAMMLASSILLGVEARLAKTDAMLLLTILAAKGALARAYMARADGEEPAAPGWALPAIFWTALGAGILLKGPLILMIVGLAVVTLVVLDRKAAWLAQLRPAIGIVWMLLMVLPWFLAIVARAGGQFFAESVGHDLLAKVASGQETHGAPPGYYLLLYWFTFWPAAPLTLMAVPAVWGEWREQGTRFLLAWLVPSWIVFELVVTKLPHYVLPLYPAIAILIVRVIDRHAMSDNKHLVRGTLGWPIVAALLSVLGIAVLMVLRKQLGLLAWPFAAAAVIFGFFAWRLYRVDGPEPSFLRAGIAMQMIAVAVFGVVIPLLRPVFPSAQLAQAVAGAGCPAPLAAAAGFHEPSLVFLVGTATRLTDGTGAAEFLRQGPCRFALIEQRHERSFTTRAENVGLRYALVHKVEGYNINGGRPITISVFRSERDR